MFHWISNPLIAVVALIFFSYIVNLASDKLGDVLHVLGIKLNIPSSVRGATFDAISSSFPEFATAMIAVVVYNRFADVGVPTVAGSAVFNILLIPMASIFAFKGAKVTLNVQKSTTIRDMSFYIVAIGALVFFMYQGMFTALSGLVLLSIYVAYIVVLYIQTKRHQNATCKTDHCEEDEEEYEDLTYTNIIMWIVITISAVWVSIDAIIQSAIVISDALHIPTYVVSVIIIAACTSIPDTLLSVKSARRGDADGAIANAIGSNIFDICICLGFPMLIAGSSIPIDFGQNAGVMFFVFASMLITGFLLLQGEKVGKKHAFAMLGVYILFLGYISFKALGLVA